MIDFVDVQFVSFNVNGLREMFKRRSIFHLLKNTGANVVLLQETHSTQELEKVWSNEWGRKIYFSHGNNFSRGVAILFQKGLPVQVEECRTDLEGRFIVLALKFPDFSFILVNVYGPNWDDPVFYEKLFDVIDKRDNNSVCMAGDFNTLISELDLYNNAGSNHIKKRLVLKRFLENKEMVDIWRIRNPAVRGFTWRKPDCSQLTMSRLDYFFLSQDLALRVNSVDIKPRYRSDHSRLQLGLNLAEHRRGKSYWKFNNVHLKNKQFVSLINDEILRFKFEVKSKTDSNPVLQWLHIKNRITTLAKTFALEKAKEKSQFIEKMENRIILLDSKLSQSQDVAEQNKIRNDIHKSEQFLLDEHENKVKAACFRSKAQYFLHGEKNSQYFFNLEKARSNAKVITKIKTENGNIISDPRTILEEEKRYYQKLYGTRPTLSLWPYINHTDNKLSPQERINLDNELSDVELSSSLMGMANNKTPGLDGLSADFYKVFWIHLKDIFGNAVRYMLEAGFLHETAKQGIISLLPKKDVNYLFLKNWRPLTILNVDYKIISRAISLRIKPKVNELVHVDQTGFLPGRNISHCLRTILDIIQIANYRSLDMIIVSLDWQKCFDKMSFISIDKALEFFNFGPRLRDFVQTLISGTKSCVSNNGHISNFFDNLTGAKQGANLSPLLWNILAEVLSIQIRENRNIQGIILGDVEHKLAQFADDLNAFLRFDRITILEFEKTLMTFEGTTGLKINYDKTCLYRVGSLANSNAKIFTTKPFVWSNGPVKILGLKIDCNPKIMNSMNLEDIFVKMENVCEQWCYRNLTLMGKVTIINSLCASLFVYCLSVLPRLPWVFFDKFTAIIRRFLWNGGRPKIALEKLYTPKEMGGLKLTNLMKKDIALKTQWVAICKDNFSIRNIANQFLPAIGQDLWFCNFSSDHVIHFMEESFWRDVAYSWAQSYYFMPSNVSQIIAQSLWFNSHILINKRVVFYEKAYQAGVMFLYNIWNPVQNNFPSYQQFCDLYGDDTISFLQYYALISAVPRVWVGEIKSTHFILEDYRYVYESFEGKMTATVYNRSIDCNTLLSPLWNKWNTKLNIDMDIQCFLDNFSHIYKMTKSTKLRDFQFRFLHRIIFCSKTLFDWKLVDSPRCTFCQDHYETVEHLFFYCPFTARFIEMFQAWFEAVTTDEVLITVSDFFFCNHEDELLNILMLIAKQHIFQRRVIDRYPNVYIYKDRVMEIVRIERFEAFNTKKFKPFIRKWQRLF